MSLTAWDDYHDEIADARADADRHPSDEQRRLEDAIEDNRSTR